MKKVQNYIYDLLEKIKDKNKLEINPNAIILYLDQFMEKKSQIFVDLQVMQRQIMNALLISTQFIQNTKKDIIISELYPQRINITPQYQEPQDKINKPIPPFLPPIEDYKFTLVLDLDETLGHFNIQTEQFDERPCLQEFLKELSKDYELVIYTAGTQDYADHFLNIIDVNNTIQHRLYRQHCEFKNNAHIKDLCNLGRNLNKTIIIDNNHLNFQNQQENAIFIESWFDDMHDDQLFWIQQFLLKLVQSEVSDVKQGLRKYRDFIISQQSIGVINPHKNI